MSRCSTGDQSLIEITGHSDLSFAIKTLAHCRQLLSSISITFECNLIQCNSSNYIQIQFNYNNYIKVVATIGTEYIKCLAMGKATYLYYFESQVGAYHVEYFLYFWKFCSLKLESCFRY